MQLDDDLDPAPRRYLPIKRHNRQSNPVDFTDATVKLIIETINESPENWGPRAIHQALRRRRHHDVPEDLVRDVMNAMHRDELPY